MQPRAQQEIYLDHNATGPVHPEVAEAVVPLFSGTYGNPSAPYAAGLRAREVVSQSRRRVAALLGCAPAELVFTSGGTESDNAALISIPVKMSGSEVTIQFFLKLRVLLSSNIAIAKRKKLVSIRKTNTVSPF